MQLTNFMVDKPCRVICISYLMLVIFGVLSGALGYFNITLQGGRGRDFSIFKHPYQVDADMLILADEYIKDTKGDAVVDL